MIFSSKRIFGSELKLKKKVSLKTGDLVALTTFVFFVCPKMMILAVGATEALPVS